MGAQAHCRRAAPCPSLSARCWCGDFFTRAAASGGVRGWVGGVARARPLLRGSLSQRGGSRAPGSASVARPRSPGAELDPGRPRAPRAPGLASTHLTDRAGWLGLVLMLGRNAPSPAKTVARLCPARNRNSCHAPSTPRHLHPPCLPATRARARLVGRSGNATPRRTRPPPVRRAPGRRSLPCTIQRSIDRARCRALLAVAVADWLTDWAHGTARHAWHPPPSHPASP